MKSVFTEANNFSVPNVIFSGDYGNDWNCRDRNGWYRTQQVIQVRRRSCENRIDDHYNILN